MPEDSFAGTLDKTPIQTELIIDVEDKNSILYMDNNGNTKTVGLTNAGFAFISGGSTSAPSFSNKIQILSSEVVVNETGADLDFRVESTAGTDTLFVDGSNGHVGIGLAPTGNEQFRVDPPPQTIQANQSFLRLTANGNSALTVSDGTTSPLVATAEFREPNISLAGTGSVTQAATLHIANEPSEGDENFAILVGGGRTVIDSTDAEALLIRKDSDGGDLVAFDSSNLLVDFKSNNIENAELPTDTVNFVDATDESKVLALDLSGFTTSTTRTITIPNTNTTMVGTGISNQIGDTEISSHTSTKITITSKGQLNSNIVYTNQANTFGDFSQVFKDNKLEIESPTNAGNVVLVNSEQGTSNVNLNIPTISSGDTLVTTDVSQTIINKTFNADNNTVSNIGDAEIKSHTSSKITITSKGQLNSNIVYTDQSNTFGDFSQIFKDNKLEIESPSNDGNVVIVNAEQGASNVNLNIPTISSGDTLVTTDTSQTINGIKTLADGVNIPVGTTNGTKIATATTQKLGFFNATPVVQQTAPVSLTNNMTATTTDDALEAIGDTSAADESAPIERNFTELKNEIDQIRTALVNLGLAT